MKLICGRVSPLILQIISYMTAEIVFFLYFILSDQKNMHTNVKMNFFLYTFIQTEK